MVSEKKVLEDILFFKLSHNRFRYRQSSVDCLCNRLSHIKTGPLLHFAFWWYGIYCYVAQDNGLVLRPAAQFLPQMKSEWTFYTTQCHHMPSRRRSISAFILDPKPNFLPHIMLRDLLTLIAWNKKWLLILDTPEHVDS
jgi:hypothetical protein